jgi:beta-galactosidase
MPDGRLFCGEYWAGWYDCWGEGRIGLDDASQAHELAQMLEADCSFNLYMVHGGTNFAFWNGANSCDALPYRPVTTSYDYRAAIDEAGRTTPKYYRFRDAIARVTRVEPPPLEDEPTVNALPEFRLEESASLCDLRDAHLKAERPQTMEHCGQDYGYILYRTEIGGPQVASLEFEDVRDYAVILVNGAVAARLDRRLGQRKTIITCPTGRAQLGILVENGGRINYGGNFARDRKGIIGAVSFANEVLLNWTIYPLPMNDLSALCFAPGTSDIPAFQRGHFDLAEPADSFLDVRALGKGTLWINGHHAGRFWNIGPQRSLYIPGVWLRRGPNEVIAFDLMPSPRPMLRGLTEPLFDETELPLPSTIPLGACCATCYAKGHAHGLGTPAAASGKDELWRKS